MTNDQRQKIAEHLRAIGDVLTEVGKGDYAVEVRSFNKATLANPSEGRAYSLEMTVHSQEVIQ
ncbi:hypothetical protein IMZ29_00870 [Achromobacter sp. GG226]|uniref:hypothetical protein n=1 Tax=Verticiella alkaliphila TaxID=2779529 RepID=UPI001C0C2BB0|nr:hypothetical protein [Verticiella sp. GG226]MBU4609155.1 hypothetical protein [Verticiella sp. GG226]